jgi:hypothetical protein
VAGAKAAVTLLKVVDPARATGQFITQPSGSRFVGPEFRLISQGSGLFPGADSVLDVTVKGSNSASYKSETSVAYLSNIVGCKNLGNQKAALARGQTLTGCVVFTIPDGVKVSLAMVALAFSAASVTTHNSFSFSLAYWLARHGRHRCHRRVRRWRTLSRLLRLRHRELRSMLRSHSPPTI